MYLSGHPMAQYTEIAKNSGCIPVINIVSGRVKDGSRVRVMGILDSVHTRQLKNGNMLCSTRIADVSGAADVTVFAAAYELYRQYLSEGQIVEISGRISEREDRNTEIICESVREVDSEYIGAVSVPKQLKIRVSSIKGADFMAAEKILARFPGDVQVVVYCRDTGKLLLAPQRLFVNGEKTLIDELTKLLGDKNVKIG